MELQASEEVTLIGQKGVADQTYNNVLKFFLQNELAQLIMQIIAINSWNRIAISTNQIFEPVIIKLFANFLFHLSTSEWFMTD